MKITVNFEDGSHQEYWKSEQLTLSRVGKGSDILAFSGDIPRYPYAAYGFYGIGNVKPEHAKGISRWGGKPYQYYQGKRQADAMEYSTIPGDALLRPEIQYEAWFDLHNGLPRAYRAKGKTWVFEFSTDSPAKLTLPTEWQAALDKYHMDLRRAGLTQ